jgi:porphyrinogen peroxidase
VILRDNMPFGSLSAGEVGTYFIGYAATPSVTELMLERMFLGVPPGNHDRILDFSTAVTGTLFFVPTADFLDDPPALPGEADDSTSGARGEGASPAEGISSSAPAAGNGSLGIGWLGGEPAP